jgi:hypothetical protein
VLTKTVEVGGTIGWRAAADPDRDAAAIARDYPTAT